MKIIFMGCVEGSGILLETLLDNGKEVCAVVTKRESSFNADFLDLSEIALKHKIPYFYYSRGADSELNDFIKSFNADLLYCFGWPHLLREDTLKLPKTAAIGFHPAALPKNRGHHPLIWALVLGLSKTASTFFYMDSDADSGDILSQEFIKIAFEDNARTLYDKIINAAKKQIVKFTCDFENKNASRIKQDLSISNIWRKRNKNDGEIDFRMNAENIYNLVRALTKPYIGAHFVYKDKEYKVWASELVLDNGEIYKNIEYGKVLKVYSSKSFLIKTGGGLLKITDCDEINVKEGEYL